MKCCCCTLCSKPIHNGKVRAQRIGNNLFFIVHSPKNVENQKWNLFLTDPGPKTLEKAKKYRFLTVPRLKTVKKAKTKSIFNFFLCHTLQKKKQKLMNPSKKVIGYDLLNTSEICLPLMYASGKRKPTYSSIRLDCFGDSIVNVLCTTCFQFKFAIGQTYTTHFK